MLMNTSSVSPVCNQFAFRVKQLVPKMNLMPGILSMITFMLISSSYKGGLQVFALQLEHGHHNARLFHAFVSKPKAAQHFYTADFKNPA
jgi:hypothetical protein